MDKARMIGVAVLLACAAHASAAAQSVGSAFPGVAPSVPSPGGGLAPPAIAPGAAGAIAPGPAAPDLPGLTTPVAPGPATPDRMGLRARPRIVTVPGLPPVVIPRGAAKRSSYSDRVALCVHYGTAAGVPTSEIGRFTAYCVQ
ncbi:MAG: hypothetical protein ACXW3N_13860 [Rhodoplanes sp.]